MSNYRRHIPWTSGGGGAFPHIVIRNEFFGLEDGSYWTGIMSSDFSAPALFLDGHDLRPLYDERATLGFNELRQWVLNESVVGKVSPGGISPKKYPQMYDQLPRFWEFCGSYGFAIEVTAFTSCDPMMKDRDDQIRHWQRLQLAARGLKNTRIELVNEYNWGSGQNSPHSDLFNMKPANIIASSGSSTADAPPHPNVWDYVLHHTNGTNQWWRRVGHNAWEWGAHYRKPGSANENTRYPDDEQSERHAYDAAAGGALLSASSCFHSQSGKYSRLFDEIERKCAKAWCDGARSVPLKYQDGHYAHHEDRESFKTCPDCNGSKCLACENTGKVPDPGTPENPGILRSYSRTLPGNDRFYVDIRY